MADAVASVDLTRIGEVNEALTNAKAAAHNSIQARNAPNTAESSMAEAESDRAVTLLS